MSLELTFSVSMIKLGDVFRIGSLGKPHGIKGEIAFTFDDDVFDRTNADFFFVMIDGLLVPFFFEEYRFSSDVVALVKLEGIDTLGQASALTGCEVYFPREGSDSSDGVASQAELVGFKIVDESIGQPVGTVKAIDDSTVNLLFVVSTESGDLLIPASHELVKAIDKKHQSITVTIPEGLLSL